MLPIQCMWKKYVPPGGGAAAVAASTITRGTTAASALAFSAGDTLVVFQSWDASSAKSCTDNNGNSYASPTLSFPYNAFGVGVVVWVFPNQSANGALVVTPSGVSGDKVTAVLRISPAAASSLDTDTPAGNNTTAGAAHTATTAGTIDGVPCLALAAVVPSAFSNTTYTASGYTKEQEEPDNSVYYGLSVFSKQLSSYAATETITSVGSQNWDLSQIILIVK